MTRFVLQYLFWLAIMAAILYALSRAANEFQIFRYAGF